MKLLIIFIVDVTKPTTTTEPQLNLVQLGPGIEYQHGLDKNGKRFTTYA